MGDYAANPSLSSIIPGMLAPFFRNERGLFVWYLSFRDHLQARIINFGSRLSNRMGDLIRNVFLSENYTMKPYNPSNPFTRIFKNEDWLAMLIAFLIIVLSAAGLLGHNGIKIVF